MDYAELLQAHQDRKADITIAAPSVDAEDATDMGIFTFDAQGGITGFEEKPNRDRLAHLGPSQGLGAGFQMPDPSRPYIASMGIYLFTRKVLLELLEQQAGLDFGRELIRGHHPLSRSRVLIATTGPMWAPSTASMTRTSC